MKVLVIHNKYKIKGGEDVVCAAECELLKRNGNEVKVELFENNSINTLLGKLKALKGVVSSKPAYDRLHSVINDFLPDVIHVHNFFPLVSPVVFELANELHTPVIMTLHNYRLICPGALLLRNGNTCEVCVNQKFPVNSIIHRCYRESIIETTALALMNYWHATNGTWDTKVSKYIALTEFAKNKFLMSTLDLDEDKIIVKPNFVTDNGIGSIRSERFLFVGRLSSEKGVEVLLQAFENTEFKLDIIGEGPLEQVVKNAAEKNQNINFLGFQNKEIVLNKMKECKALVFPSIWYEGMPMTILEAFSTGCPVIASKIGAMKSLVEDGSNGLHFIPGNGSDLRSKLNLVTEKMSEVARATYINNFTPEKNYELLMRAYQQAINS